MTSRGSVPHCLTRRNALTTETEAYHLEEMQHFLSYFFATIFYNAVSS